MTSEIRTMSMEQEAFSEAPATAPAPESALAGGPPSFAGLDAGSFPGQAAMDAVPVSRAGGPPGQIRCDIPHKGDVTSG